MPRPERALCAALLCALAGCSSPNAHDPGAPAVPAVPPAPTAADLPEPERPFAGRWRVDTKGLAPAQGASGPPPMDRIAFAAFSTLTIDLEPDHAAAAYWGIGGGTGAWTLSGDTVTLQGSAPNFKGTRLVRSGDRMTCSLGGVNPPMPLVRVDAGAPVEPRSLEGQWQADMEASASASASSYRQMMDTARALYGDSIGPVPTMSPELMRAQLAALFGGRRPVIAIAADPPAGGGVGEIRGLGDDPMAFTYTLRRDILYVKDASAQKGAPQVTAFRVSQGQVLWDFGTAVVVFKKR